MMEVPKLRVPMAYPTTVRPLEVPLPVLYTGRTQATTPRIVTDPLLNLRVRDFYRRNEEQTVAKEVAGRAVGGLTGAAIGRYTGKLLGSLVALAGWGVSLLVPGDFGTIGAAGTAAGAALAGQQIGGTIGTAVGATAGTAYADYTTYSAMRDLVVNNAQAYSQGFLPGILNSLYTLGRSVDVIGGGEAIRASIYSMITRKNVFKTIAESYGMTEEGREEYEFEKIRTELGIDIGSFGNTTIDLIGDLMTDPGFVSSIASSGFSKITKKSKEEITNILREVDELDSTFKYIVDDPKLAKELSTAILESDKNSVVRLYAETATKTGTLSDTAETFIDKLMKETREKALQKTSVQVYDIFKNIDSLDDFITARISDFTLLPFTGIKYTFRISKLLRGTNIEGPLGKLNYLLFGNKANWNFTKQLSEDFEKSLPNRIKNDLISNNIHINDKIISDSDLTYRKYYEDIVSDNTEELAKDTGIIEQEINKITEELTKTKESKQILAKEQQAIFSQKEKTLSDLIKLLEFAKDKKLFELTRIITDLKNIISRRKLFKKPLSSSLMKKTTELCNIILERPDLIEFLNNRLSGKLFEIIRDYSEKNISELIKQSILKNETHELEKLFSEKDSIKKQSSHYSEEYKNKKAKLEKKYAQNKRIYKEQLKKLDKEYEQLINQKIKQVYYNIAQIKKFSENLNIDISDEFKKIITSFGEVVPENSKEYNVFADKFVEALSEVMNQTDENIDSFTEELIAAFKDINSITDAYFGKENHGSAVMAKMLEKINELIENTVGEIDNKTIYNTSTLKTSNINLNSKTKNELIEYLRDNGVRGYIEDETLTKLYNITKNDKNFIYYLLQTCNPIRNDTNKIVEIKVNELAKQVSEYANMYYKFPEIPEFTQTMIMLYGLESILKYHKINGFSSKIIKDAFNKSYNSIIDKIYTIKINILESLDEAYRINPTELQILKYEINSMRNKIISIYNNPNNDFYKKQKSSKSSVHALDTKTQYYTDSINIIYKLNDQFYELQELFEYHSMYLSLNNVIGGLNKKLSITNDKINKLNSDIKVIKKEISKTEEEIEKVNKLIKESTSIDYERNRLERRIKHTNEKIKIPNKKMYDAKQQLKLYKEKMETLRNEVQNYGRTITKNKEEIKRLDSTNTGEKEVSEQIVFLTSSTNDLIKKRKELWVDYKNITNDYNILYNDIYKNNIFNKIQKERLRRLPLINDNFETRDELILRKRKLMESLDAKTQALKSYNNKSNSINKNKLEFEEAIRLVLQNPKHAYLINRISMDDLVFKYIVTELYPKDPLHFRRLKTDIYEGVLKNKIEVTNDLVGFTYNSFKKVLPILSLNTTNPILNQLHDLIYSFYKRIEELPESTDDIELGDTLLDLQQTFYNQVRVVIKKYNSYQFLRNKLNIDILDGSMRSVYINDYLKSIGYNVNYNEFDYQKMVDFIKDKHKETDESLEAIGIKYIPKLNSDTVASGLKQLVYGDNSIYKDIEYKPTNRVVLNTHSEASDLPANPNYFVTVDVETSAKGRGLILQFSIKVTDTKTNQSFIKTYYLDPDDYDKLVKSGRFEYDQEAIKVNKLSSEEIRKRKKLRNVNDKFITQEELVNLFKNKGKGSAISYMFNKNAVVFAHNAKFDFASLSYNLGMDGVFDESGNIIRDFAINSDVFDMNIVDTLFLAKKFNVFYSTGFSNDKLIEAYIHNSKKYTKDTLYKITSNPDEILPKGLTVLFDEGNRELYFNGRSFHDADIDIEVTSEWAIPIYKEAIKNFDNVKISTLQSFLNGDFDVNIKSIDMLDNINETSIYSVYKDILDILDIEGDKLSYKELIALKDALNDRYLMEHEYIVNKYLDGEYYNLTYSLDDPNIKNAYNSINRLRIIVDDYISKQRRNLDNFLILTKRANNIGRYVFNKNYVRGMILENIYNNQQLLELIHILTGNKLLFDKDSNQYIIASIFSKILEDNAPPQLQEAVDFLRGVRDSIEWEYKIIEELGTYDDRQIDLFYQLLNKAQELKATIKNEADMIYELNNFVIRISREQDTLPVDIIYKVAKHAVNIDSDIFMLDAAENFSNRLYQYVYINLLNPLSDILNKVDKPGLSEMYKNIRGLLENVILSNRNILRAVKEHNNVDKLGLNLVDIDDFIATTGLQPADLVSKNYKETIRFSRATSIDQTNKTLLNNIIGHLYKTDSERAITNIGRNTFTETRIGSVVTLMSRYLGISVNDLLRTYQNTDFKLFNSRFSESILSDTRMLFDERIQIIYSSIEGLTEETVPYINNVDELKNILKNIFINKYIEDASLDYRPSRIKGMSQVNSEKIFDSNQLFQNVKSIFYKNNGNYDEAAKSFRNFFSSNRDLVLINVDYLHDNRLIKIKTSDTESLKNVLMDKAGVFSIMSNAEYIELAKNVQPVKLPGWLQSIHKYLILPQKLFSLTFSLPFMITNMLSAYLQNVTNNGFHPIKAFNTLIETSKEYHKWKNLYQLGTSNLYFWEKYKDYTRIDSSFIDLIRSGDRKELELFIQALEKEDSERYADLIKFLRQRDPKEFESFLKISEMAGSVASYTEIIDVQRNMVIGEQKKAKYNKLKNDTSPEAIAEFWVINEEPNAGFATLKEELDYLNKVINQKLEFKDNSIENLYRRRNILKEKLDTKFNKYFSAFQKYTGMKWWLDINNDLEIIFRMSMIQESLEAGKSFSKAAQDVIDKHFIYSDKSIAERMAEIIIPFVSYPIKAAKLFSELTEDAEFVKLMCAWTRNSWDDENVEQSEYLSRRKLRGDLPVGNQLIGLGNAFTESLLSLADPLNTLNNKVNPIAKPLIDVATNAEYNRWTHLLGPFSGPVESVKQIVQEQTFNPGVLFNISKQYERYNDTSYYRAYPQRAQFYNNLYTKGGYSRVAMNMQNTTLNNLRYRVGNILYKNIYSRR